MTKAHAALPVSEIHQSSYNVDDLIAETISAIAAHIQADYEWTPELQEQFDQDIAMCERWSNDTQNDAIDSYPGDILIAWEDIASKFGISVIEDGEAGWTYVGYDTDHFIVHFWDDFE